MAQFTGLSQMPTPSWQAPQAQSLFLPSSQQGINTLAKNASLKMPSLNPTQATPTAPGLTAGQATLGSINAALSATQLGLGIWNQIKSQELAEKQLKTAKDQLDIENTRWQNREDERKANNQAIAQSANALQLPTERY
ncbi:hypothetical protein [Helicobacter canis]|uniref:Uncharacterized protein n=1 Tax=Helicobacter canis TaxID=29419 RepID=A0A377J191_9HELI|nr:hypothetical protein [Helicobacter canis]STO96252.1 Uncharacterised protein [Helicobacter canis]